MGIPSVIIMRPELAMLVAPRRLALGAVAVVLIAVGCRSKTAEPPADSPAPPVVGGTPASAEECKQFARQVEKAVADRDRAELDRLWSIEDLALRCFNDVDLTPEQRASATAAIRRATSQGSFLSRQVLGAIEKGATYKFLRVHEVGGRARVMFRLANSEAGVNYYDFLLTRSADGRLTLEDVYLFATGEMITQSMRRLMLPALAESLRGTAGALKAADQTYLDNFPKILAMGTALRQEKAKEAVGIYQALPAELRNNKSIMLGYIRAALKSGEDDYTKALALYRTTFPDDAAIDILSIDYFLLRKEYDEALRCIASVEAAVGGDPYLRAIRANVLTEAKRFDQARAEAEKAVAEEPTLPDGYWSRITVALREKNHKDTLAWLKKVVEQTGVEIGDLHDADEYKDFVRSPEHAAWEKWYAARPKAGANLKQG